VPPPPPVEQAAAPRFVPVEDDLPEPEIPVPQASAEQRMKLARAFLDIGDDHSAKQLLRELLDDADPVARTDAARLLRELG
jgi:pilus assembly protein FimV